MKHPMKHPAYLVALCLGPWLTACPASDAADQKPPVLAVGEQRDVELRFLRFDVSNFEKRLTRKDILAFPKDVRDRMWMLDLDLSSGPNTPQLLDHALAAIRALDPNDLEPAERNMRALLMMTPDTANLTGTALDRMTELAPLLGIAPEQVLAELFNIDVDAPFLSDEVVAQAILDLVIGSHPNARTRLGPKTDENPEGVYPVKRGTLPVTLGDAVSDFKSLGERFGPYAKDGVEHPGFIVGKTGSTVLTDEFALTVRANANALPYKGVDLTRCTTTSVNSVRSQIAGLFDFSDPNWLRIEGLVAGVPKIDTLTFRIVETARNLQGGRSPVPTGMGNSPAWLLPEYALERVLIEAGRRAFQNLNSQVHYTSPGDDRPLFDASVESGWQEISVRGGLGSPPLASYVWDLLLEVAETRLHDGGIAQGEANVEFTLKDIPLGTDTTTLKDMIRDNLRADPLALIDVAQEIIDSTEGDSDFYFYRASPSNLPALQGDWLFFVNPSDIAVDEDNKPVRSYRYAHPGFYADAALTKKISVLTALDGDTTHEKIRLEDHRVAYVEDDEGAVFKLTAGEKPSPNRRNLRIQRVR